MRESRSHHETDGGQAVVARKGLPRFGALPMFPRRARRALLFGNEKVSSAAYDVGSERPTQFSRE